MRSLFKAFKMVLWLSLLTGVIYPMLITGLSLLLMPKRATGSMILSNDKVIGSSLIAQNFTGERYFWPRPSAVNHQPLPSGGSNLGPTSLTLKNMVQERKKHLMTTHALTEQSSIPSELVYASASGIDPHISSAAVDFQFDRVAKARNLDEQGRLKLSNLIKEHTDKPFIGLLGVSYVNVLELNYAMDQELAQRTHNAG